VGARERNARAEEEGEGVKCQMFGRRGVKKGGAWLLALNVGPTMSAKHLPHIKCTIYIYIYIYIYIAFTNTLYFINFSQSLGKFITEKEGEFNPTITFYSDYPVRNPNSFRSEKN
jgi:hypothetical protein